MLNKYPIQFEPGKYRAVIILSRIDVTTIPQNQLTYFTPADVESCRIEFLNKIIDTSNMRILTGMTKFLRRRSSTCDLAKFSNIKEEMLQTLEKFPTTSDLLSHESLLNILNLQVDWSNCTELFGTY